MEADELMRVLREKYATQIKPYLEDGSNEDYGFVIGQMGGLLAVIELHPEVNIKREVHMGSGFLESAKLLLDGLVKKESIALRKKVFEMYCSQTELPLKE
ncbi:hypothetical protein HYT57_05325 [Candidatus Woesearchaeota archaeon]|nr:hypothetical protein [Candidatus Woesearchaeota archaeon]